MIWKMLENQGMGGEWSFQKYGSRKSVCEISQVSQSRFLRGLSASRNLKLLQGS